MKSGGGNLAVARDENCWSMKHVLPPWRWELRNMASSAQAPFSLQITEVHFSDTGTPNYRERYANYRLVIARMGRF
jgi:hypothetical protein